LITPAYSPTATERVLPRLALDFTTATLDPRVTVTRALNTATRVNSSGFIETVNADLPRFDFDPVTKVCKGLLIEEARQNLFLQSAAFNTSPWTVGTNSITPDTVTSPDGGTNADTFTVTSGGFGAFSRQTATLLANTAYTLTCFFKKDTATFANITVFDGTDGNRYWFNLANGTVGSTALVNAGYVNVSAKIENYGQDWYRCSVTFTTRSTTAFTLFATFTDADGSLFVTNGRTGFIWGAQLEAGSFATSYIPTTTSSLTRNADVVQMTGTNFSSWYNASEGAFVVEASSFSPPSGSLLYWVLSANDGATSNTINVAAFNNLWIGSVAVGGVSQADLAQTGVYTAGATAKIALGYKANSFAASVNSLTPLTDSSGSVPSVNRLDLGNLSGIFYLDGHIRKLNYYPQRLTNAELQAFSK